MISLDVLFEIGKEISSYGLWEIQRQNNFLCGVLDSQEMFRLKNLATGLFLNFDKINNKLSLTQKVSAE